MNNKIFIKLLFLLALFSCKDDMKKKTIGEDKNSLIVIQKDTMPAFIQETDNANEETIKIVEEGFLFVKTSKVYHSEVEKELVILDKEKKPMITFKNELIYIDGKSFEIIDEDYLYEKMIQPVESFDPEYGLFILKAKSENDGFYEVLINDKKCLIDSEKYTDLILFKPVKQYVLDSYPNPTKENPLRASPDKDSEIISNYENYTYISVEIKGDWLKVMDDKDCYIGEEPSKEDIIGWVRWRKNGKIIIDISHVC